MHTICVPKVFLFLIILYIIIEIEFERLFEIVEKKSIFKILNNNTDIFFWVIIYGYDAGKIFILGQMYAKSIDFSDYISHYF